MLFGPGSVNHSKVHVWTGQLLAIGWHFDFVKWTVMPKPKGLAKLVVALFDDIKLGQTKTDRTTMKRIMGLLSWYGAVIPAGRSFVDSLFTCGEGVHSRQQNVYILGVCAAFEMNHFMGRADMARTVTISKDYQNIKKGLFAMHAKEAPEASKLRIPFCTDMALLTRPLLQKRKIGGYPPDSEQHSLLALRIYVVMLTGICFILRKSEHMGAKDKRPIARTGLTFYDKKGVIPYVEVVPGRPATHVIINIKFSKMDQTG